MAIASVVCWPHRRASTWGEPARPGFPRRGNGKGAIQILEQKMLDFQYEC